MTKQFDNTALRIYQSIRKDMPKPKQVIKSKKDKHRKDDIKKGRKPWKDHE
jgi:hypothetical protein